MKNLYEDIQMLTFNTSNIENIMNYIKKIENLNFEILQIDENNEIEENKLRELTNYQALETIVPIKGNNFMRTLREDWSILKEPPNEITNFTDILMEIIKAVDEIKLILTIKDSHYKEKRYCTSDIVKEDLNKNYLLEKLFIMSKFNKPFNPNDDLYWKYFNTFIFRFK
ncbi:hypothetical protein CLPU_9c00770 [Gottschalkia purinilytica]|uniref:Uncharacterized protein n=1 Tax=Gottschalkia purinilytica TaxID=1503 RepID=A0A0L0W9Q9_GOTPU|nr:hypothetical protein [Gottschalkia purinilytica]KNF08181.1 hypothetical protein CLPU_9c00770 [Gottschalkia purinilytica]